MSLLNRILNARPELRGTPEVFINGDIIIRDDGDGVFLAKWEHPTLTKPTTAELAAASEVLVETIQQQIDALKAQVTDDKMRAAVLDTGGSGKQWLKDINDQIDGLEAQMP